MSLEHCNNKIVFFENFSLFEALSLIPEDSTPVTPQSKDELSDVSLPQRIRNTAGESQVQTSCSDGFMPSVLANSEAVLPPAQESKRRDTKPKKLHKIRQREQYRKKTKGQKQLENLKTKLRKTATVISTKQDVHNLKHAIPGFTGIRVPKSDKRRVLSGEDEIYIEVQANQKSTALVDKDGRIFAIRVSPNMSDNTQRDGLTQAIRQLRSKVKHKSTPITVSRGDYRTVTFGVSYGNGQTKPQKLQDRANEDCIQEFIRNPHVQAYVKHALNAFNTWNPGLLEHYKVEMEKLKPAGLSSPFPDCPLMATTVNLGPQTVTDFHRDSQNLAYGWCVIIALGDFDYKNGGQLHFKEAKATLEFAPGQIIIAPSAALTHGNEAIQPGEERYSLTLYTAGQLFQWASNNCRPKKCVPSESPEAGEKRWFKGWSLYSKISEFGLSADV